MRIPVIVTLLVGLALSACDPPPEAPVALSEPGQAEYDQRLLGKWYFTVGDQRPTSHVRVKPGEQPGTLHILAFLMGFDETRPVTGWLQATAFASEINGNTYYNIKRIPDVGLDYTASGERPGYIIAHVIFDGPDVLTVCFIGWPQNRLTMTALNEQGLESRKVTSDQWFVDRPISYVVVAANQEQLRTLIREVAPEELFHRAARFSRLGTPHGDAHPMGDEVWEACAPEGSKSQG